MQWVASGFLFVRGNTIVHRLDPRVRLLLTGALFSLSLVSHVIEVTIIILILIGLMAVAKNMRRFGKSMIFAGVLTAITFLLDYYVFPQPFLAALTYGLRLFAVISSASLFFLTTTPDELELVMKWFHLPSDFVMVFVIAVRFVPVLLLDSLQIMDAQRSRGLEFDKGGFLKRLRNSIPLLVPLIAVAVNRSLELAEAMDSRAYGASKRPTSLYFLRYARLDYVVSIAISIGFLIGFYAALLTALV